MDLATLIGMLGAIGFVVMSMVMSGEMGMFINVPSAPYRIWWHIIRGSFPGYARTVFWCR